MGSTTTIIRNSIAKAHGLPVKTARNADKINKSGNTMKMMGQVTLKAIHKRRTIRTTALVVEKLRHKMILLWRDCIELNIVLNMFPLPKQGGQINEIQTEAEAIKETISNKYNIIRDLTEPAKNKGMKIIPYRASTTRQIPLWYCRSLERARAHSRSYMSMHADPSFSCW